MQKFKNYSRLREEPLKSAVREDFFASYLYTQLGNIDFVVAKRESEHTKKGGDQLLLDLGESERLKSILWAEAKQGTSHDIYESFVQLILTIGKEKTHEKYLPPKYLGAFDAEKFAFIEYHAISDVFYQNDFDWTVAPSNHKSKEFLTLKSRVISALENNAMTFKFESDEAELREFISLNFRATKEISEKISVTKNNFVFVYQKWLVAVKPTISVSWDKVRKKGVISADFFLADLLSEDNRSIKENLFVVLKKNKYAYAKEINEDDELTEKRAEFTDGQAAHKAFWAIYARPPREEYWDYIVARRDLLVPQDVRERKGSFFTPQIWVEKSQAYLAAALGEDWQEEYYIWDCCAGTGNLLNGLTNPRRVWASTLDDADVSAMKDRVKNGWNMFEDHIFKFDFLNDDFEDCPTELREILQDPEKRKKLVIYINPPYAEATTARTVSGTGKNKAGVATENKTYQKYKDLIGNASNEIYAQFFIRIHKELSGCILGEFSKIKVLQASNFAKFREIFQAKLKNLFLVPANTFDNVKGHFPIGFFVWDTDERVSISNLKADVFNNKGDFIGKKAIFIDDANLISINKWIKFFDDKEKSGLAFMGNPSPDFQHCSQLYISLKKGIEHFNFFNVTKENLIPACVYLAVRQCIEATWLNDRDQFLYPEDGWESDEEFKFECLIFTLFHGQNRISCEQGANHFIPFSEAEVGCKSAFSSTFMHDFIEDNFKFELSAEAGAVYEAGRELWRYYHAQKNAKKDAAFYDIRKYFQGEKNGKMNSGSDDERYTELIADLRAKMKILAAKIARKVYKYGFLR